MRKFILLATLSLGVAAAQDLPNLNGTWQLDPAHSQGVDSKVKTETLTFHQTDDGVTLTEIITDTGGKETKTDIQCKTDGNRCKLKQGTVSLWYDATALLLMEERRGGNVVLKRRFQPSEDGKTLTVEVTPIAPPGQKGGSLTFLKQADTAGQ
jgi:hypothetical protein